MALSHTCFVGYMSAMLGPLTYLWKKFYTESDMKDQCLQRVIRSERKSELVWKKVKFRYSMLLRLLWFISWKHKGLNIIWVIGELPDLRCTPSGTWTLFTSSLLDAADLQYCRKLYKLVVHEQNWSGILYLGVRYKDEGLNERSWQFVSGFL